MKIQQNYFLIPYDCIEEIFLKGVRYERDRKEKDKPLESYIAYSETKDLVRRWLEEELIHQFNLKLKLGARCD
jgi:hypothetical protein